MLVIIIILVVTGPLPSFQCGGGGSKSWSGSFQGSVDGAGDVGYVDRHAVRIATAGKIRTIKAHHVATGLEASHTTNLCVQP